MAAKAWARFIYPAASNVQVRLIEGIDVEFSEWQANRVGILDGTPDGTSIGIDFGTITSATAVIFKNNNNSEMRITLPVFRMVEGAVLLIIQPSKSEGDDPLSAVSLTTTGTQSGDGIIETIVASGTPEPGGGGGGGGVGGTTDFIQINAANNFIQKNPANDFITIGG